MYYNVREKVFPDGTVLSIRFEKFRYKGKRKHLKKAGGPAMHGSGQTIERKELENMKRARQMVWDYGRANSFDWWITLTFSADHVIDRYDYKCCAQALYDGFTHPMAKKGCRWLLVPDQHEDGAYHFHGLLWGDISFTRSLSPNTGRPLFDNHHRPRYNIDAYKLGFSSAVPLDGCPAVVMYLTEYYTKNQKMRIPKGCKRYWASRNLVKPEVRYDYQELMDYLRLRFVSASYTRVMRSKFSSGILVETSEEQLAIELEKWGRQDEATAAPATAYWSEDDSEGGVWAD